MSDDFVKSLTLICPKRREDARDHVGPKTNGRPGRFRETSRLAIFTAHIPLQQDARWLSLPWPYVHVGRW
jgi:hypothetical protein